MNCAAFCVILAVTSAMYPPATAYALAHPERAAPLHPPAIVLRHLVSLREISRIAQLPAAIRGGRFIGPAGNPVGWALADPGGSWQSSDVATRPRKPNRRLIFAACDSSLCILHYEVGGFARNERLLALERHRSTYTVIWSEVGFDVIPSIDAFRKILRTATPVHYDDAGWQYSY